jgi:hypothetical protein
MGFFFHWLYSPLGPWPLIFGFIIILQTVGLLGRVISTSQGLYLNTGQHKHRISTHTCQISMPCVGFEPTIPASEWTKSVHDLDRSATVTSLNHSYYLITIKQTNVMVAVSGYIVYLIQRPTLDTILNQFHLPLSLIRSIFISVLGNSCLYEIVCTVSWVYLGKSSSTKWKLMQWIPPTIHGVCAA